MAPPLPSASIFSTPAFRQFASDGVAPEGPGHGIKTFRVDGNDFFAVYEIVRKARQLAIETPEPILIEAMTYRMGAHSTSDDPTRYRDESELSAWESRCPIARLRLYLEKNGLWDASKEESLQQRIREETTQAIDEAKKTEKPPLHTLVEDVYFEIPATLKEQYRELTRFFPEEANG